MNFQIGKVSIHAHRSGILIIVAPVGNYMLATKFEGFELKGNPNSISANMEIYQKDDAFVVGKVKGWIEECEEKP